MKTDKNFSPITPSETRDLAFDFRNDTFELDPAEYLVSAVFTLAIVAAEAADGATVDATPSSRLSGTATIADNEDGDVDMAAVQRVTGMLDGNTYDVICRATSSRGQVLELNAHIACRVAA